MIKETKETLKTFRPSDKQLRGFGIVFAAILGVTGWFFENAAAQNAAFALGGLVFFLAAFQPRLLFPVSFALMTLTVPIGWIISRAILISFFYTILTPISVVLRVVGVDLLKLNKTDQKSYWEDFEENKNPDTMGL